MKMAWCNECKHLFYKKIDNSEIIKCKITGEKLKPRDLIRFLPIECNSYKSKFVEDNK